MSEQEKKWGKEAMKEGRLLSLRDMPLFYFVKGYLQACRKRQEEIERLKEENRIVKDLEKYWHEKYVVTAQLIPSSKNT